MDWEQEPRSGTMDSWLREHDRLLTSICNAVPALVSYLDRDCRYLLANDEYKRWFGIPPARVIGRTLSEIVGEAAYERIGPKVEAVLAGVRVQFEDLLHYADGRSRWVQASYAPDFAPDGSVRGFVEYVLDVTDRKRAELETDHERRRLLHVVSQLPGMVCMTSGLDHEIALLSPAAREMLGNRAELIGKRLRDAPRELGAMTSVEAATHVFETGETLHFEDLCVTSDWSRCGVREERFFSSVVQPLRSVDGSVLGVIAFAHEVSDQVKARRELEASRKQAAFLAEASALFSSSLDLDSTLASVARLSLREFADICLIYLKEGEETLRVAAAATDSEREELLARTAEGRIPLSSDVPPARVTRANRAEWEARVSPSWLSPHLLPSAADGERNEALEQLAPCSFIVAPLSLPSGVLGSIAYGRAAGSRAYTESDLLFGEELARRAALAVDNARSYLRAEEASRLKDEFLATVSHELRTPLSAILGWATILHAQRGRKQDSLLRGLEVIERNARSQARIIEDILDVSRIVRGQLHLRCESVDLSEIARTAIDSFRAAAAAKCLKLEFEVSARCQLQADGERLRQVLWNLLANAVKFTPVNGEIKLVIESDEGVCTICLSDNGQGIEPRFLPYLFEPFRQADGSTRRSVGGLGLGLALVRHLVELHGGTISASSAGLGQGATFVVSLPIVLPHHAQSAVLPALPAGP